MLGQESHPGIRISKTFAYACQIGEDMGFLAQIYKTLDQDRRWFILPKISVESRDSRFFNNAGQALAEYEVDEWSGSIAIGREFSRYAALGMGINRYGGSFDVKTGDPSIQGESFDGGEWWIGGSYDRLDNPYLPSKGSLSRLRYIRSEEALGADTDFEQLTFSFFSAKTWGRHNLIVGARFNTTLSGQTPSYALFTGGGFLNLSGYERNELLGEHFGLVLAGYRHDLGESSRLPGYVGMTLEYGSAAFRRSDVFGEGILNGSLYVAYDSPLGPIYLGYGKAEERGGLFFLRLGNIFNRSSLGR